MRPDAVARSRLSLARLFALSLAVGLGAAPSGPTQAETAFPVRSAQAPASPSGAAGGSALPASGASHAAGTEAAEPTGTGPTERRMRDAAAEWLNWREDPQRPGGWRSEPVAVRILGLNDFHGQLTEGRELEGRPVGGAAVLKSWLDAASAGWDERVVIASVGDLMGASPLPSALLRDEPTLSFFNSLGNAHCRMADREARGCNLVATPGNHEFDKGRVELLRRLQGGDATEGPYLDRPWRGVNHSWIGANVIDTASGRPLLPGSTIKDLHYTDGRGARRSLPVGFIGAVLRSTPSIVLADGIAGLAFGDEAAAINREVRRLQRRGVEAIVVLLHQGGTQPAYEGFTDPARPGLAGEVVGVVERLDAAVDVVLSAHTHQFANALLPRAEGGPLLVTQAWSAGTAFAEIDLKIDPRSRDVVDKRARIVTTYADSGPGLRPDPATAAQVARAQAEVGPMADRVVAHYRGDLTRRQNDAGESALGNLIADAQAATQGTHFAFTNPGGIRADLRCPTGQVCEATFGQLFSIQPFGNLLTRMDLSGDQIRRLLEQQWQGTRLRFLQVSGLRYGWDARRVDGFRCLRCVTDLRDARSGEPLDPAANYSVTVNRFLADGGDNFSVLLEGRDRVGGPLDLDSLIDWLSSQPQPFAAPSTGPRIQRLN